MQGTPSWKRFFFGYKNQIPNKDYVKINYKVYFSLKWVVHWEITVRAAISIFFESLALISIAGCPPFVWHHTTALSCDTSLPWSVLFPMTTNGNLSGFFGSMWARNSLCQVSKLSNVEELLTSYTKIQQSAPLKNDPGSLENFSTPFVSQIWNQYILVNVQRVIRNGRYL